MNINKIELQARNGESSAHVADCATPLSFSDLVKLQSGVMDRAQASVSPVT